MDQDNQEREFAESVLTENKSLLEGLALKVGEYAGEGRSDKMYILTQALIQHLTIGQAWMKQTLADMQGGEN